MTVLLLLLLLSAATARAIDVVGVEHRGVCTAAAGIASVPVQPEAALVACDLGIFPFTIGPSSPLVPDGRFPVFSLPFDLNGSEPNPPPSAWFGALEFARSSAPPSATRSSTTCVAIACVFGEVRPIAFA